MTVHVVEATNPMVLDSAEKTRQKLFDQGKNLQTNGKSIRTRTDQSEKAHLVEG